MQDAFSRMELLVGNTGVKKLSRAKIAVFGLGGAGSQVAESLARCGVGSLTLIDHEKITLTNIGSQVLALHSTLGMSKVEAAKKRIRDIDENILVHTYETFYNEETAGMFELRSFDLYCGYNGNTVVKTASDQQSKGGTCACDLLPGHRGQDRPV